ncbi:Protein kinase, catalytic domain-containing protein [Fagus crenata]
MWGNSAALNNRRPCWSEEAVSSELRERLDRWSEGWLAGWWATTGGTKNFKSSMNYVKNGYERVVSIDIMVTGSKVSRWRMLWRKLKKEKKKFFNRTTSLEHVPSYDSYTYLQNFDQGSMWTDPDNHCRSFSARFAVPSRILQKRELVG